MVLTAVTRIPAAIAIFLFITGHLLQTVSMRPDKKCIPSDHLLSERIPRKLLLPGYPAHIHLQQ